MADIHVAGVTKRFSSVGEDVALSDITFDVPAGQFLSIVGASGSGKSTLLRIIGGLLPASGGSVRIGDRPVREPPPGAVYLFQQYTRSLFAWKTVLDNVTVGVQSRQHGLPPSGRLRRRATLRRHAGQYLEQVGLSDVASYYPHQLSGGMQQRVAIARALAAEPETLLMDEPFSAVDALTRMELQDLVLRLWASRPITVILVTHDIDEAIYSSDRILVLDPGGRGFLRDFEIALPRPREQLATREIPAYGRYRRDLHRLLTSRPASAAELASLDTEDVEFVSPPSRERG